MDEKLRPGDEAMSDGAGYGRLMKNVARLAEELEASNDTGSTIQSVAGRIIAEFRDPLGIRGGRLYRREGAGYVLQATFGEAKEVAEGLEVPANYPPVRMLLDRRTIYMDADDPRLDRMLENRLGVETFAAIEVGDREYLLAFDVAEGARREEILHSLGILRFSINQKVREEKFQDIFRQARRIQSSIVPRKMPSFGDFDIFGRSDPMEDVGGDHFDFLPTSDTILGLAIADVSGHGLPAALQVRDVYMGLRMGMSRDFKIVRMIERLNAIIHSSTLSSRFVSMVYGELELRGTFIYVNAGHPPPFHLRVDGTHRFLGAGGAVLGPLPNGSYDRGFVNLRPGETLVLYTDGLVEANCDLESGEPSEFGVDRLLELVRAQGDRSAQGIVEAIFDAVDAFCEGQPAEDDRTAVVVKRKG